MCQSSALGELSYAEDPCDNVFAEEFTFYGGSYLVFPGIAEGAEFMLTNLCKAIFLGSQRPFPQTFVSEAFSLLSAALRVMHHIATRAGIRRGTLPVSNRGENILVPGSDRLNLLKRAVKVTKEEIRGILEAARLSASALDPLVLTPPIQLADYDVANGPLLWSPFIDCGDSLVLAIPGMVVSAVRNSVLRLAANLNLKDRLAEAYNRAVWDTVVQSLSHTRNEVCPKDTPKPRNLPCSTDGFFALDRDKILYCLLTTDSLARFSADDPFGIWTTAELQASIKMRISEVERFVFTSNPAPNELFVLAAFQGLGGAAAFGLDDLPFGSHCLLMSAADLQTLCFLEGGNPLALYDFARAQTEAHRKFHVSTGGVLDEFCLYRHLRHSYYVSDSAPPNVIVVPPGDALKLRAEVAQQRDFHAAKSLEGGTIQMTSLHSSASIPISVGLADTGRKVAVLVEGLPLSIWVTGPGATSAPSMYGHYAKFADAVAFWFWQMTPALTPVLTRLDSQCPLEIRLDIPADEEWMKLGAQQSGPSRCGVEATVHPKDRRVDVTLLPELIPLLHQADNIAERELMRIILTAISSLLPEADRHSLAPKTVQDILDRFAPIGLKKMILLFDLNTTPQIDPRGLPQYRPLQEVKISEALDEIGLYVSQEKKISVGPIDPAQWNEILNDVAFFCFRRIEEIVSTLSPNDLLDFCVAHAEAVCREHALDRFTIPTRMECFSTDAAMMSQLGKKIPELSHASLASRFLVEYVVARPPKGLRPMSFDCYDRLSAFAYHLLNYAMLSDAVRFKLQDYRLSFLPSGRLGIDGASWQSAIEAYTQAFASDQIAIAPANFRRQWEKRSPTPQALARRQLLDAAMSVEFGHSLTELLSLMRIAIDLGHEIDPCVPRLPKADFVKKAANMLGWSEGKVENAIQLLSLSPRPAFWSPPAGYAKQELYPWRYNRELSYFRRPFLICTSPVGDEVVWGNRHLQEAQYFLIDQSASGRLRPSSQTMKSVNSTLRDEQGKLFNDEVANVFLQMPSLSVKIRVKKIGPLRELQDHLGDIDVLVSDPQRKRVLVIECKDLSIARTPYEMAKELEELFVGKHGKKSVIEKQSLKTSWVTTHLTAVLAFLEAPAGGRWGVEPVIVVDQPLVAPYLRETSMPILSLETLKRQWPKIKG